MVGSLIQTSLWLFLNSCDYILSTGTSLKMISRSHAEKSGFKDSILDYKTRVLCFKQEATWKWWAGTQGRKTSAGREVKHPGMVWPYNECMSVIPKMHWVVTSLFFWSCTFWSRAPNHGRPKWGSCALDTPWAPKPWLHEGLKASGSVADHLCSSDLLVSSWSFYVWLCEWRPADT